MYVNKSNPFEFIEFIKSKGYSFYELNGHPISEKYLEKLCNKGKNKKLVVNDFLLMKN